ncbi:MAG TPA: lytic transglycosylase domain-containing protein [Bryobacteraceae bacterium]|jgi:soluble lytic murein transglycosylase-like protein
MILCLAGVLRAADSGVADQLKGIELQRQSLEKQRNAVRQQIKLQDDGGSTESFILLPALPPLAQADCPSLNFDEIEALIASAAKKYSLPARLIRAVMRQESGFYPCAVSIKGAQGLMQLMPATAYQLRVADPFDPVQNVEAGTAFLKRLLDRYRGDLRLALVAYNAGATRADQLTPAEYPIETQGYLANIFAELDPGQ